MQRLIERADAEKLRKAQRPACASSARRPRMSETWGRTAVAGTWPHPKPVWTVAVRAARGDEQRR